MFRRFVYLLALICMLASLAVPAQAYAPTTVTAITPTPRPGVDASLDTLTAQLGEGIDPQQVSPAAPLVIVFNQGVDLSSAHPALLTFPYQPGTETWDSAAKVLTFQADGGFPGGKTVQVYLNPDLRSKSSKVLKDPQPWTLNVQGTPRLVSFDPPSDELMLRLPTITLEFDREMDSDSLKQAIQIEPATAFDLKVTGKKVDVNFTQPLDPGAQFKLSLTSAAKDKTGTPLDRPYSQSYRIRSFELSSLKCDKKRLTFDSSYAIPQENFKDSIVMDPPVAGQWFILTGDMSFAFNPDKELDWGQSYTIHFKEGLKDSEKLSLPASSAVTCTVDPPFTVYPLQKEESYDYNTNLVQIKFQIPMDGESVKQAFKIEPETPGSLTFDRPSSGYDVLNFIPEQAFSQSNYTVTLDSSVRTADHHAILVEPYQWQFKVSQYSEFVREGAFADYGPNIQVVDAEAPRYLQIVNHGDKQNLYFDAYALDLPAFVERYRTSFGQVSSYNGSNSAKVIDTTGLERVKEFTFTANKNINDMLLPEDLPNGLYVLNMRTESARVDQIFLVLSRNTIAAKLSGSRLFTWTTNINGESAGPVEMRLYTQTGELMREGKADDQGIYETSRPSDSSPMLVAARDKDGDITLTGLTGAWSSNRYWYDYDGWHTYSTAKNSNLMAYIFTDRPIYRPGNTLHYKVILRNDNDMRYTPLTSDQAVTVRLRDARDNLLEEREQHPNDYSTLNGDFTLPAEGNLGSYKLEVSVLGDTTQQPFTVEEYHKPDYSVTIQSSGKAFVDGDIVKLDVDASYFLGQPVANADVTLKFYNPFDKSVTVSGKTDANGHYTFDAIANFKVAFPYYYYDLDSSWGSSLSSAYQRIDVTVSDGSNQPVSATTSFRVYNAAQGIGLDTHGYFKTPGKPFTADISAITYDGKPIANQEVQLTVYDAMYYNYNHEVSSSKAVTDANGKAAVEVKLEQDGDYKIVIKSATSTRAEVYDSAWVTAYQPGQAWSFGENKDEFSIHAEKNNYQPYNKAKLLIRSTFSGPALLTFERGSVLHTQPINLTAPLTEVETEIIPEYGPNVFVTVNAWQEQPYKPIQSNNNEYYDVSANRPNSRMRITSLELKVESLEKPLNIAVTSDKTTYVPREKAEFTIQVSSANGPEQAELAVGLVDEAIYSLKNEPWRAIYDAFYAARPRTISNYDSLAIVRLLIEPGGKGGGGGEPQPNLDSPRSDFPDTAIWLPAVVTDAKGKATVSLTLPDTLTRWRLTVRAVTRDTHVGETTYTVQTQQAIALRPAFPSIITEGDQLELAAYVHNTGSTSQTLSATLASTGLTLEGSAIQAVEVKPGDTVPLRWKVRAGTPGEVQVTVRASGKDLLDAIQMPITVQPRATLSIDQRSGEFSGKLDVPVFLPPSALDSSSVRLELSRSLAGDALSGLESLIGYPYGCVEQTMSKALPNAVVGRALKRLGLSKPELDEKLPSLIDAGVKKLYGMQHYDGGWGWWTDDATDDYQTAWVVFGLSMTRDAGYTVDPQVIQRGAKYLRKALNLPTTTGAQTSSDSYNREKKEDQDARLKAFMLYSLTLAGQGDEKLALELYQNAAGLDAFSQSALALALHKLGLKEQASQLVQELESSAYQNDGTAYWPGINQDGEYHSKTMSSEVRTAALALEAIQTIHPESQLTGAVVRYLMAHKQASGWGTTNETAFTLLALTGQLEAAKNVTGPTGYQVLVNGQQVSQVTWKAEDLTSLLELPRKDLAQGLNRLEIVPDSETGLFYTLAVRLYGDAAQAKPAGVMTLRRDYLDPKTGKALTSFEPGQLIQVRLSVGKGDRMVPYVMIEDHLPGGLEALNEGLNTTSREFNEQSLRYYDYEYYDSNEADFTPFRWQAYGYNNKEIHDGRVNFFITSLGQNGVQLSYYARALRSGTFTALPAEVSAMYDPDLWGRTETTVVNIK